MTSSTLNKNSNNTADGNNSTDNTGKWVYLLDKNNNLAQVVSPTAVRTGYQYNDPNDKHNLTEKFGYNDRAEAELITQWQYDAYDRAISSTHKDGIEKVSVVFDKDTVIPTQAGHIFTNRLTNSVGETTDYRYQYKNGEAQLLSVIGAGCVTCGPSNVSYEYDSAGRVVRTSQLDGKGQAIASISTVFDEVGRVVKLTQTNSTNSKNDKAAWRSYSYDNTDYPMQPTTISWPSVVDDKTAQIKFDYDESGNVIAKTEIGYRPSIPTDTSLNTNHKIERTTRFHYTKVNGRDVVTAIDAPQALNDSSSPDTKNNNIVQTKYVWDKSGENIIQIQYPEGLTESFDYQTIAGQSLLAKHIAPDGVTTTLSYNARALPIAIQRGDQKLSVTYDSRQRPIKWQNQLEQTISASYDETKQQVTYQMHDGQQIVNQYDTEGQLTQYKWLDKQGNVIVDPNTLQYNDQNSTNIQNDIASILEEDQPSSNPAKSTVADNNSENLQAESKTTFNPVNTLLDSQFQATVEIDIDPLGNIQKIILPEGGIYKRLYDDFGRTIYAEDANTDESIVEYDLNDQPTLIQSATVKQSDSYDDVGRLTATKYCKLGIKNVETTQQNCESIDYKYDGAHLSQIIDPTQTTNYSYDTQGRVTVESVQFKDSQKQWQTEYQYDDKGRIDKVGLPEGATLSYLYDDISMPIEVKYQAPVQAWWQKLIRSVNNDHNSIALISDIKADSARGLLGFTHSNGQTASADYDKVGRLTKWTDGDYQKALTYDKDSQIIKTATQQDGQSQDEQLGYNSYGELTDVSSKGNKQEQFNYDLNGNRLTHSTVNKQSSYTYETGTDRLLSVAQPDKTDRYQYDKAGNPTLISTENQNTQTQRQLTYGARGQLTQLNDNKQTTQYRYNHAMQRVSKTININTENKQEQRYLWQQGLLDAEIDVNDNQETLIRRYIYVGLRPIAMIDYDKDNTPSIYTIHTDHLGTPQQVSNDKQEIVWQGEYDAFGQVTVKAIPQNNKKDMQAKQKGWLPTLINSANAAESTTNELFEFNLRFAGQYEDSESGYYYNWHRYYNPETGRYLTSDPIGLNGGLNTYGYAGANPFSFVDPWGLQVVAQLSISKGLLTFTDTRAPKEVVSIKAFSGGLAISGEVSQVGVGPNIPVPLGTYIITENPNPTSNPTWYGLLFKDNKIDDFIQSNNSDTNGRSGFRLHPGTLSHGCVTIDTSIPSGEDSWEKLDEMLKKTNTTTVTYEEPWYARNRQLIRYGQITIVR